MTDAKCERHTTPSSPDPQASSHLERDVSMNPTAAHSSPLNKISPDIKKYVSLKVRSIRAGGETRVLCGRLVIVG